MSNLLDKASIILTPTAYNNGEALCVKPSDGSGDFTFSRNSAATRVNAQGLVENVQILSSNLVQNGDFSEEGSEEVSNGSFSQEGVELVTNGDFATDSDWFKSGQVTIGGGVAYFDSDGTFTQIAQNLSGISGKSAKVVIEITEYNQGTLKVLFSGGAQQNLPTSVGTHTLYFSNVASNTLNIARVGGVTNIKIDNVSVREVGQDWSLGTGWSIGEDKAISDNTGTGNRNLRQNSILIVGASYKITFDIDVTSGFVYLIFDGTAEAITTSGTYTYYKTASTTNIQFRNSNGNFIGSITNISVKEVGQNWDLGTGWEIGEDKAIGTSATGVLYTNITITSSNKARIKADVDISGGGIQLRVGGVSLGYFYDNIDYVFTSNGNGLVEFVGQSFTGSITNISVIEITDDTNLPRINYEGFSYQDALGSEEIVNGDFSNGSTDWSLETGWSISGGVAIASGSTVYSLKQVIGGGILPNTTYQITYNIVTSTTDGAILISLGTSSGGVSSGNSPSVGKKTIQITTGASTNNSLYIKSTVGTARWNGSIDNVSVKEYLGQEVVPDSGCGSWLFEPQSTNIIEYSEDFSNSYWAKSGTVVISDAAVSPDGTLNADKLNFTASNGEIVKTMTFISGQTYTMSFYAKTESGTLDFIYGNMDYSTISGTATNEWQRFVITQTLPTTTRYPKIQTTEIGSLLLWGFQVEQQSYATSYIPTSGATVTRNQDVCNNGGSLATINSTEGVLYAEIAINQNDNGGFRLISMTDASDSVRIGFGKKDNEAKWYIKILIGALNITSQAIDFQEGFQKIAIRYKSGDSGVYINGTKVITDTSNYVNTLIIDNVSFDFTGNAFPFFGKTKALAVWKEALSDQELTELTTI